MFSQMDQSFWIRPTTSNCRKKTFTKPPNIPIVRETKDQPVASYETTNIIVGDSEEEVPWQMEGGLVDLSILKSYESHVASFIEKR